LVPSLLAVTMSLPSMITPTAAAAMATAAVETKTASSLPVPRLLKTAEVLPPRIGDTHRFTIIWMHGSTSHSYIVS
jgi:SH3-like domain-containing protein